jgi:hypothetical protein
MVQAINELVEKLDNSAEIENGKELIATAVGEPLTAEESFDEMSNDINSLLSQFKTNMMNNGVTVESNDRFKSLIDKIATLADNEGKGIQFASGNISSSNITITRKGQYKVTYPELEFIPNILFITGYEISDGAFVTNCILSNLQATYLDNESFSLIIDNITNNSCYIVVDTTQTVFLTVTDNDLKYYAIGVGEEDSTLRDSLASILQEEGVNVTEEDDMASLITKVDEEFDRKNNEIENSGGLDIISATELPATGRENQICIISSNPVNKYNITTMSSFNSGNDCYDILLNTSSTEYNYLLNNGNLSYTLNIDRVWLNKNNCSSYYYTGTRWKQLTQETIYLFKDGEFLNTSLVGTTGVTITTKDVSLDTVSGVTTNVIKINCVTQSFYRYFSFSNQIDFSKYSKIKITARSHDTVLTKLCVGTTYETWCIGAPGVSSSRIPTNVSSIIGLNTVFTEYVIDISSWTTTERLVLFNSDLAAGALYISSISIE